MEEKSLRQKLEETAMNLLEKSEEMKSGTDEHTRTIESVTKLCKAYEEDYKIEVEVFNQNLKVKNDIKRNDEEIEIRKLQLNLDELKHKRVKADNIFLMAGFGVLTAGACIYEIRGGHILPGKLLQFANYIPKAIKL